MKSKYLLLALFVTVSFSGFSQFKINEYSCSNVGALNNPIGVGTQTSPDWVELINTTPSVQTITSWYISNDRNNLYKWQVPLYNNLPIKIDSFSTQVIFLDTYDEALPGTVGTQTVDLHTNFQLNQTQPNTYIYLTKGTPAGTKPYDSVLIKRLQPDHSWGKPNSDSAYTTVGTGTPNVYRLYKVPSPGKKNPINPSTITTTRNWYLGYAPTPKLLPNPGYYTGIPSITVTDTTNLSMTFTASNLEIFGSYDCTVPTLTTSTGSVTDIGNETGPVTLPNSGAYMVRAVIIDQGTPPFYLPSFEAYGAYVVDSSYHMNVTCVCMDTNSLFITRSKDTVPTLYSYMDKTSKKEVFKNSGQALINKIDFFNAIGGAPIKQWQFQFRSEDEYGYNYTNKYAFYQDATLGATARADFPELVFRSSAEDEFLPGGGGSSSPTYSGYGYGPNHVRDFFNHTITLRHKLNFESPHYTPTYLFINGSNRGIYYIKEPLDTSYTQYYSNFAQANIIANDLIPTTTTPQITALSGNLAAWNTLYSSIMLPAFNIHTPAYYQQVLDAIDIPSFIDYNFYNMFSVNVDYTRRQALWWQGVADTSNHSSRKWRFGLSNTDLTWGFGTDYASIADNSPTSSPCDYVNALGSPNNQFPLVPLFTKLMTNDTFKSGFLSRYQDLLNTSYSCDSLTQHYTYIQSLVKADMPSQAYWFANPDSVLWSSMIDSMNIFLTQRCSLAVQGLKNCYGYDGPYNLCVDVFPPNSGYVKFNSLTLQNFVWNGKYLDSVTYYAYGIADSNYVFDYWETPYNIHPNKNSDSINFFVDRDACIKAHFKLKPAYETTGTPMLPTAFSPNGDGNNDILNVYGIEKASSYEFEIYNRWGEQIFHSLDKTQGWDGIYNSVAAPVGVYAYRYNIIIGGKTYINKGSFTLLR